MRYRVVEEKREDWVPIATIFEAEGRVFRFARGRKPFLEVDAPSLEQVSVDRLPYAGADFRLGPVTSVDLPEHELQRLARGQGEQLPSEFIEENHLALLSRLRSGATAT